MMDGFHGGERGKTAYEFCVTHDDSLDFEREEAMRKLEGGLQLPREIAAALSDRVFCETLCLAHLIESAEGADELALIAEGFHAGDIPRSCGVGI